MIGVWIACCDTIRRFHPLATSATFGSHSATFGSHSATFGSHSATNGNTVSEHVIVAVGILVHARDRDDHHEDDSTRCSFRRLTIVLY